MATILMSIPVLGEFDPTVLKKHPHYRTKIMESARSLLSTSAVNLYPYSEMIQRAFNCMQMNNPDSNANSRRIKIPQIKIERKGKKTIFSNFVTVCQSMKRDPEHVKQYICTEQNTDASIDGTGALLITGRLQPNVIEMYILQYVHTYVKCPVCGSGETKLEKNNRLLFIKCNQCTAQRTVQQIKGGFYKAALKRSK